MPPIPLHGVDLLLLGPVEARCRRPAHRARRPQAARGAGDARAAARPDGLDRPARGRPLGRAPPPSAPKMVQLYVSHCAGCSTATARRSSPTGAATSCGCPTARSTRCASSACSTTARAREALALWRGEALADVADEPFAAAEIRRLEELRLHAAELAIDADLAAGRHGEVIGELEALIDEHPLREQLHARRMLALYRCGRQAEALEAYRDARACWSRRSASSLAASCGACRTRSSPRTRRSTLAAAPPRRRPGRRRRGRRRAGARGAPGRRRGVAAARRRGGLRHQPRARSRTASPASTRTRSA